MTKKEQISKFLQEWNGDGYTVQDVYIEKECADLMAEGIVKFLNIHNVVVPKGTYCDLYKKECMKDFCSVTPNWQKCKHLK